MIKSTLNWLGLISTKKTWQTVTIDKDDCAFSVVYSLLKIKRKACISENIFTIFKWQSKSRRQKSADVIQWFSFSRRQSRRHLPNADVSWKDWWYNEANTKIYTRQVDLFKLISHWIHFSVSFNFPISP